MTLPPVPEPKLDDLFAACCHAVDVEVEGALSRDRRAAHVCARHLFCYLARESLGATHQQIADHLGCTRGTSIYACRTVADSLQTPQRRRIAPLIQRIAAHYNE